MIFFLHKNPLKKSQIFLEISSKADYKLSSIECSFLVVKLFYHL